MVRRYGDLTIDEDGDADRVDITVCIHTNNFFPRQPAVLRACS
jgi:hypothetical protein